MTTKQDIYASHAAFPILASTLLPPLSAIRKVQPPEPRPNPTTSWNLEPSLHRAFSSNNNNNNNSTNQDSKRLLRCGIIVGLSYLREWSNTGDVNPDAHPDLSGRNRDLLGDVSRNLLASFLRGPSAPTSSEQQQAQNTRRVFIIHPIQSTTFAPETLFNTLTSTLDTDTTHTLALLDNVDLLPIHDFPAATQAISQVSDTLSKLHRQHTSDSSNINSNDDYDDADSDDDGIPPALLILEGLDALTNDTIHTSNPMRGSALLTPALRTLTHLSRAHASFLSVLLVNTMPLGAPPSAQISSDMPGHASQSALAANSAAGGLYSVFAREQCGHRHGNEENGEPVPLLNTLLARTLDQGIDVHLLLQRRRERGVVEVVKDRMGDGLGRWCVWK